MVNLRSLTASEVASLPIFPAGYSSDRRLEVQLEGEIPDVTWKLVSRPMNNLRRKLAGDSLGSLVDLYGPEETLRFIGAFDTDELVGLITWKFELWNQTAWLCDIRVRRERRREGIARRMLEDLLWTGTRIGARGIMLETQNTNYPAIEFYISQGFELSGLNTRLYDCGGANGRDMALFFFREL